ncbi:hypothetical protein PQO01_03655 [Lentisphaera marina]|uniref:hypothetical protein n=1 Tax=Lentisphaera marina TaxID=1111041 RepID=UPI002365B945|nr:hypothetical protein [Lentisphaera marina]MDD7984047.1 hypothetical protein [Lentisphaera marina]
MRFITLLITVLFIANSSLAKDLIKDPQFKKFKDYWWVKPHNEYQSYKPVIKKGVFAVTTKHTSESHYYGLVCPVEDLREGKKYKLTFEMNCEGDGMVNICARTTKQTSGKKNKGKAKTKNKLVTLGLAHKEEDLQSGWKKYTCEFTATENPNSDQVPAIKILIGEFQGTVEIRKMSLQENASGDAGGKKGKVSVRDI